VRVLSLFSGCGGIDLGAQGAGMEAVLAIDSNPVAIETYKTNFGTPAIVADLTNSSSFVIPKSIDVVVGGPPCQGFSSAGPKDPNDPRNKLWKAYLSVLKLARPRAFLVENVPGFEAELPSFLSELSSTIPDLYQTYSKKIVSQYYGVPQFRHRIFLVGIRKDVAKEFRWPAPVDTEVFNYTRKFNGMTSMQEALEDLGPPQPANSKTGPGGLDHVYLPLSASDEAIARHIPNGGSLKNIPDSHLPEPYAGRVRGPKGWTWYFRKPRLDLPARSVLASVRPNFSTVLGPDVHYEQSSGAWRMQPIDAIEHTSPDGLYTSPVKQRRLSIREYARIQTFPDSFRFHGSLLEKYKMIGNAVPCELARRLCSSIAECIN